ncbi:hypothetical protein LEMA_P080550.1 [Plenodomus lingam JN3]|uniref:BTB domain-containing protein n=1 Tax=Leptosphaeria maculans (strain JN3 / isolate v23.1.3 / race Av1-4-5-6-7-8) TaxID=985895 RepID=E5A5B8_LEPMJ|nr:hypothetical protein LEMA_P080550.1 [Plenodomus lingam JN3]CBX98816.1 hypothetical protein LEMA_P080550.1 [Plenodomus lingam JN3]
MPAYSESRMLDLGAEVITVQVEREPDYTKFTIHETLIRKSSLFFEAALGRKWREAEDRIVKLPTLEAGDFRVYIQWLYTGRLHVVPATEVDSLLDIATLAQAHLLGDYLQDTNYQDHAMDLMIEWYRKSSTKTVQAFADARAAGLYERTAEHGGLRRFLVDVIVWRVGDYWPDPNASTLCDGLLQDVLNAIPHYREGYFETEPLWKEDTCVYHCHEDNACYKAADPEIIPGSTSILTFLVPPPAEPSCVLIGGWFEV